MQQRIGIKLRILLSLIALVSSVSSAASEDTIAVTIYDFPPDIINSKTKPAGPLTDKMKQIMKSAGLSIQWLQSSLAEESVMLSGGSRPFCTTGRIYSNMRVVKDNWIFLPYTLHTLAGDALLVHHKNLNKFARFNHITEVFEADTLTGVFISDVSYGSNIDSYLNKTPERFDRSASSTDQIIAMVSNRRADYGIVSAEYWRDSLRKNQHYDQLVDLADQISLFKNGNVNLHLACSRAVPSTILARIEAAMQQLGFPKSPEKIQSYITQTIPPK